MNGRESNTSPASREDFRTYRTTTRLVSDTIADTAHLSLRLAERLLRNGTVDVSPSGAFAVRLELEEADLPAFQNAIQLRVDLGETIDDRFRVDEPSEDDHAENGDVQRAAFVSHSRWFVSRLSRPEDRRTVMAGTDFRNEIVGIWPSDIEASLAVLTHNAAIDRICADDERDLTAVGMAIRAHALEVAYDEGLFATDGTPIVPRDAIDASERRERKAYANLVAEPCRSLDDVRSKVNYILNGTVGDRDPLMSILTGVGGLDPIAPDGHLATFLRSLLGEEGNSSDRAVDRMIRIDRALGSALDRGRSTRTDVLAAVRNDVPDASDDEVEEAAWRTISTLMRMNANVEPDASADQREPQPPEPFETFTTLGAATGPVLLRMVFNRMRAADFAEAANGRTFQMSRLVVAALTRTAPESFRDISNFVRDQDASATDEEIEDAAMRTMGIGAVR